VKSFKRKQYEYRTKPIKSKQLLEECDALFITAGAGMGVDSGLPRESFGAAIKLPMEAVEALTQIV